LEQIIARQTPLPLALKLTFAVQACRAFDYAHKRGIIHRDIKPANVMVSKENVVKVVDFGIARVLNTSKTQTGMLIGTFAYMSPQQYQGAHADERSDIWSFGVMLYELLCYQRPFAGENPANLMHSICQREPRPLHELAPDCPPEMEVIICKILQKSPEERFQSMEDLLLELEPVCKELQTRSIAELINRSRVLIDKGGFAEARELLRESIKLDPAGTEARTLIEKVNGELQRAVIRAKVQEHLERGHALLGEGKFQEASAEAGSALQLDSRFEPAQELQKRAQQELARAQAIAGWLQSSRQSLAEGLPDEAEALANKVLELDPSNEPAKMLQQQAQAERAERQRRARLLEKLQEARGLWMRQNYQDSIRILTTLQEEFPAEDEVQKLLETVLEDQSEQQRQQGIAEVRTRLANRQYDDCKALLGELQKQFPNDPEIPELLNAVKEDEAEQRKLRSLTEARSLLAAKRYAESITLLTALQKEFPQEGEISRLLAHAAKEQAKQQKQQTLAEGRALLATQRFDEALALLDTLRTMHPGDTAIQKFRTQVEREREKQAQEQRLKGELDDLKKLVEQKEYLAVLSRVGTLQAEFPGNVDLLRLADFARVQQAQVESEKRLRTVVDEVKALSKDGRFTEAVSAADTGLNAFPQNAELLSLLEQARLERKNRSAIEEQERKQAEIRATMQAGTNFQATEILSAPSSGPAPSLPTPEKAAPGEGSVSQPTANQPTSVPHAAPPAPAHVPEPAVVPSQPTYTVAIPRPQSVPAGATKATRQVLLPATDRSRPRDSKKPAVIGAVIAALALGLILAAWVGLRLISPKKTIEPSVSPVSTPVSTQPSAPAEPQVSVTEPIRDDSLAKLRQQEAKLWQQALDEVQRSEFDAAKIDLQKIVSFGKGGVRKADAQNVLDNVIPQREEEEGLFRQAVQYAQAGDAQNLQRAVDVFGQVIALEGPQKAHAAELQRNLQDRLSVINRDNAGRQIASLANAALQNVEQGDLDAARQKAKQVKQLGGDTTALNHEIDQAQAGQTLVAQQREFQQALQTYKTIGSRDKLGLEKSRGDFMAIGTSNGPLADRARQYVAEINKKLDALNTKP